MKSFLKFAGIVIIIALISFGASLYVSKEKFNTSNANSSDSKTDEFANAVLPGEKVVTQLATGEEASSFYAIPGKAELRFFIPQTGEIKSLNLLNRGTPVRISTIRNGAHDISWSPDGTAIFANYGDLTTKVDLATGTSSVVDKKIQGVVFSKTSEKVAYTYFGEGEKSGSISIADVDFENFQNLLKTRYRDWKIAWISEELLEIISLKDPGKQTSVFTLDRKNSKLTLVVDGQQSVETNWSPDGSKLLYSRKTAINTELFLYTTNGGAVTQLGVIGKATKCAWTLDSATLYCALPTTTPIPATGSDDSIAKIDLSGYSKPQQIASTENLGYPDVRAMLYSHAANALIYKNFKDGKLYLFSLQK